MHPSKLNFGSNDFSFKFMDLELPFSSNITGLTPKIFTFALKTHANQCTTISSFALHFYENKLKIALTQWSLL